MSSVQPEHLAPSHYVDSAAPGVQAFARDAIGGAAEPVEQAARLFTAVRDGFWYDPFSMSTDPAAYRASAIVAAGPTWCVPKAVLLTAAARALGIPARLGFADVRNHVQTPRLRERMGGAELFVYHGYTDLHLDGRWVKATPAFNAELCARFGVAPIEFDGRHDALLHEFSPGGGAYMEYVRERGVFTDLPLEEILTTFRDIYGPALFADDTLADDTGEPDAFSPTAGPGSAPAESARR
ncbi:MAG: transglutaminase-like domain-containing protein [Pseudonocardia sp.]